MKIGAEWGEQNEGSRMRWGAKNEGEQNGGNRMRGSRMGGRMRRGSGEVSLAALETLSLEESSRHTPTVINQPLCSGC